LPPIIEPHRLLNDVGEDVPRHFEQDFDPFHPPARLRVNLDLPDAELSEVVLWFSALTGQNFIIADNVDEGKRITIIGPTPVTIDEAFAAFYAALHMNGLTVIPYGSYLRIVPEDGIEHQPLPFTPMGQTPNDDRMVTQIVPLGNVEASAVTDILEGLKTPTAVIQVYAATNTLIIHETGTNMRRLLEVIAMLDTPGGDNLFIYQVQYASAEDLRNTLLEIFGEEREAPRREERRGRRRRDRDDEDNNDSEGEVQVTVSEIIADARTNQLIIKASPRAYETIRQMAEALDIPIAGEGQIHVLFLENANATELASTLQGLTQSVSEQQEEGGRRGRRRRDDDDRGNDNGGSSSTGATFTGDVSITADEPTNALVVVASLRDFLNLERVVEQLDRRREQVYVEAVILEITTETDGNYGIALNTGALPTVGGEAVPIFGATSLGGLSSIVLDSSALLGLAVGLRGPEIAGTSGLLGPIGLPSFGAVLTALQQDRNVNVLSTPHILTMDNEEAEIIVGQNIPFLTGGSGNISSLLSSAAGSLDLDGDIGSLAQNLPSLAGLGIPSFNVQRESVSLTLRIRPQINESNFVRLEIEEQVEDIISTDRLLGPTTSIREARTVVVVEDQQTIVIGGLIQDQVTESVHKVPFLGDIPIIGYLFRTTTTRTVKRNLLLLLTPYIIRSSADFHEIFRRKIEERQEFLEFFGREELDYVADIDYGRKNGPLESIYETIIEALQSEENRRRAEGLHDNPQIIPSLTAPAIGWEGSE
jgi:general secretion pathway protein D